MAADKRKILETARKYAQKGAKDKALKEFGKLLKLDPRDSKVRLEMGDTHRRWGQVKEAIEAYSAVAEQFTHEGFDARAVAVFKQIQNLQPDTFAYHEPLAELYQRMGLTAEAIGSLESAAESYRKAGQKHEALGLLRKMAAIDPSNTTSRIKVADLLQQEGMKEDAISEYDAVLAELEQQGDTESCAKLFERILQIQPERVATIVLYTRNLISSGAVQRAESLAKRALELDKSPEHYELLADVYRLGHRDEELVSLYRELANLYRERGDEERTREILQRYVPLDGLGAVETTNGYIGEDEQLEQGEDSDELSIGDETTLLDGDLLSDASLLVSDDDSGLGILSHVDDLDDLGADALDLVADSNEKTCLLPDEPPAVSASRGSVGKEAAIDINQLLAEASVYLRYGKRSQAIANLESILERDANHRLALEKLGDALAEGDAAAKAVEMWSRAAKLAAASGEADAAEMLRSRIAALDSAAAQALELAVAGAPVADSGTGPSASGLIDESIDDLDLFDDSSAGASGDASEDLEGADLPELDLAEVSIHGMDLEIDIDDASFAQHPPDEQQSVGFEAEAKLAGPTPIADVDMDEISIDDLLHVDDTTDSGEIDVAGFDSSAGESGEIEVEGFDGDTSEGEEVEIDAESSEREAPTDEASGAAEWSPERISEELEEADFYLEQGLLDEAEAVYSRILSLVPNHPHAMVRLGEIATQRGEAGGLVAPSTGSAGELADPAENVLEDFVASDIGADLDDWHEDLPALDEQEASRPSAEVDFQALEPGASSEPMAADRGVAADGIAGAADREHEDIAGEELVAVESDLAADLGREGLADLGPGSEFDAADATGANEQDETGEFSGTSAKTVRPAEPEPLQAIETPIRASAAALDGGVAASAEADNFGFDLAAELSQSFDRDPGASGSRGHSASGRGDTSEDGFASVFAEFKKGVSATLSEGDYQAHYDLGIAYREMGLLSDAITELRLAMNDPERRVGCLHLMGICANEMGEPEQAIGHLTAALSADGITGETVLAVKLDLGTSHQAIGDIASARRVYEEVHAVDPHFADVVSRLDELEKFEEVEAEDDGVPETEEYESFEEFAEDLDEPAAVESAAAAGSTADAGQAPVWESFDDFVAEVDTEDDADSALREADAVAPAEFATDAGGLESAEPAAATETTPKRRKKKISFV